MHYNKLNKQIFGAGLGLSAWLAASCAPAYANEPSCRAWQARDIKTSDLKVGAIQIVAGNIFNPDLPEENQWYHQTTNRFHIKTQDQVIAQTLLFKPGDSLDLARIAESERLLRTRKHLKDVKITLEQVCGKQVNMRVVTTDNWTLTPSISFGRSGGNNSKSISIEEHNLLGLGKELNLSFKQDEQRNQSHLIYNDPQVLGTRYQLSLGLQTNSDGKGHQLTLGLPFYKLAKQNAWGLESTALREEVAHYEQGEVTHKVGVSKRNAGIFYGWSQAADSAFTERYRLGWQQEERSYFATENTAAAKAEPKHSYPWLSYELIEDRYTERENFKTMGRTEDIALGHQFLIKAGFLHPKLGSEDSYLKLFSRYSKGYSPASNQLSLLNADLTAWLGDGSYRGLRANLTAEWNLYSAPGASWHLSGELHTADNLQHGEQLLLGGDNGLRGYPTGYRLGEHTALLRAERRFYFKQNPLGLVKLGAAAFVDAGTAWGGKQKADWFGDAGVGLRIIPTRASSGKVIHVDIAVPFTAKGKLDKYQVLVGTGIAF